MRNVRFILAGFMAALLCGSASGQDAPDTTGYAPFYMLYTGEPSPERLAGLRQFLALNRIPREVSAETLETVSYKLRQHKTGFAYPVYVSDTATDGNACIVADSSHDQARDAAALLAGGVVAKYVLDRRMPVLKRDDVLENIMQHELFHCHEAMSMSLVEIGTQIARDGPAYYAYRAESGADAYAALIYLRNGGDKQLLRQIRDFRTLNLLNGDAAHYTSRAIDYIIWNYDARRLIGMNIRDLVALAKRVRDETALTPEEFTQVSVVAGQFQRALLKAVGEAPLADTHAVRNLVYEIPADSEYASQLILQVRSALYGLGGDIRGGNAFHTVFQRYYLPNQFRIAHADIAR